MSNKLYEESAIQDIANAIRSKSGTSDTFKVAEMGDAVRAIPQGGVTPTGTINITSNGTTDVTNYASANVNVPTGVFPSGTLSITENGTKDVTNYASVNVAVPGPSGSQTYTQNGTYDVSAIAEAVINVSGGGGLPSGIEIGFLTPASNQNINDSSRIVINHSLGSKPTRFFLFDCTSSGEISLHGLSLLMYADVQVGSAQMGGTNKSYQASMPGSNGAQSWVNSSPAFCNGSDKWEITSESVTYGIGIAVSTATWEGIWLFGGRKYMWVAIDDTQLTS